MLCPGWGACSCGQLGLGRAGLRFHGGFLTRVSCIVTNSKKPQSWMGTNSSFSLLVSMELSTKISFKENAGYLRLVMYLPILQHLERWMVGNPTQTSNNSLVDMMDFNQSTWFVLQIHANSFQPMVPSCEPTASLGSVANQTAAPIMNGDAGPPKNAANFAALTPLHFLERAAEVFPERPMLYLWHHCLRRSFVYII